MLPGSMFNRHQPVLNCKTNYKNEAKNNPKLMTAQTEQTFELKNMTEQAGEKSKQRDTNRTNISEIIKC